MYQQDLLTLGVIAEDPDCTYFDAVCRQLLLSQSLTKQFDFWGVVTYSCHYLFPLLVLVAESEI